MDDLKWFLMVLGILWFAWFFTSGPNSPSTQSPFVNPPAPLDGTSFVPHNNNYDAEKTISDLINGIEMSGKWTAKKDTPDKEYIELEIPKDNTKLIDLTKWTLQGISTGKIPLGEVSVIVYSSLVNLNSSFVVSPGDKIIISSGRSPIGVSFKLNKCSGYLEQFQNFYPPIQRICPRIIDDVEQGHSLDKECLDYLSRIRQCTIVTKIPKYLSPYCDTYINSRINYNQCVEKHKRDTNFLKPEWRIFLKQDNEIWNNKSDVIRLFNENGILVNSLSY